jgi:hypothetical protein
MVEYTCYKCKKMFKKKYSYDKHIARKNPCDRQIGSTLDNNHECKICDKIFSSYSSLHKHTRKNCNTDEIKVFNNIQSIDNRTINNQNNHLSVDGDVKVVKFGSENLSYISDDLFKHILGRGFRSVSEFIEHSHFSRDHPENHNIYIANIRDEYIVLYDGGKWTINQRDDVMEDIIYAKSDFLFSKFKELQAGMTQIDIERFMKFMNERDNDGTMARLKEEVKLQLYNNRRLPQRIRRQMEAFELNREKIMIAAVCGKDKLHKAMTMLGGIVDSKKLDQICELLNS